MNATLERPTELAAHTEPKVWVISDTHWNHANIIKYENRPFESTDHMDEEMIRAWNLTVAPGDIVYHLGDVVFGSTYVKENILPRLNGYKILRMGNHDRRNSKSIWLKYFDEVYNDDILLEDICLSHEPLSEYEMTRLLALGLIKGNCHGHLHSAIEEMDQSKYKCVSVELTDYRPIPFDEVKAHFGVK